MYGESDGKSGGGSDGVCEVAVLGGEILCGGVVEGALVCVAAEEVMLSLAFLTLYE